jgi:hypothetical protein
MLDLTLELVLMSDNLTSDARPIFPRFNQLVDALEAARARYAIIGAAAVGAHGHRRYTEDIDVLVAAEDVERVLAELAPAMRELGRTPAEGPPKQVRLRSKQATTQDAVDIDILVPVNAIEEWALATAIRGRAEGRKVDIASAEALVVMKLVAYLSQPESERGGVHRTDALALLRVAKVDVPELRRFLKDSPELLDGLERLLAAPPSTDRLG